ncbi:MAG: peptidyl-prolyl cis-trans isomerase [Paracoccaceae bacterium]
MSEQRKGKGTSLIYWLLLGFLVLGLGGFGVTSFSSSIRSIGSVGDREIPVTDYAAAMNREIRALSAQFNTPISFAQAEQLGIAQAIRAQVISATALSNETDRLHLSVGDQAVQARVLADPAFKGIDGQFDRAAYADTLRQNGLTEQQFESRIRDDAARGLLQTGVMGATAAPAAMLDTVISYERENRSFDYAPLSETLLSAPVPDPTEAEVQAEYDANPATYTTPETRKISFVRLTPDMLLDKVTVDEDALRAAYDARSAEFNQPERRLVERLVFGTRDEADAAKARLDAGETDFEALVAERGLTLGDIDLGEVSVTELGAAGDAVFALTEPGVAGPLDSDLGPALFRMNGILEAQETTFEEAREDLSGDIAMDAARRMVLDNLSDLEDRLAGGATLEDLDKETDMELGSIAYSEGVSDGIAAYDSFRAAAAKVTAEDFPELVELEDGGIFALRLDELQAPALRPLNDVRDAVVVNWRKAATEKALIARGEEIGTALSVADAPVIEGVTLTAAGPLDRRGFVEGVPPEVIATAFEVEATGKHRVVQTPAGVWLVILRDITAADAADADTAAIRERLSEQLRQSIANDTLNLFTSAIEAEAGIHIDEAAVNAVHAQFR